MKPGRRFQKSSIVLSGLLSVLGGGSWGSKPVPLVLLYTNDTQGFLAPCGCLKKTQRGSLARRVTLLQALRTENANVLLVDSGNLTEDGQGEKVIMAAMRAMRYDAMGVGMGDLKWATRFFETAKTHHLAVLVSVLRREWIPHSVPGYIVKQVGEWRVGILAITPIPEGIEPQNVYPFLAPLLEKVRAESNLVVVLSQLGLAQNELLAQDASQNGGLDILIGNAEARVLKKPKLIGKTWILPTSVKGQHVGKVEIEIGPEGIRLQHALLPVDDRYPEDPVVGELVAVYYAEQAKALFDASLRRCQEGIAEDNLAGSPYVPAERCAPCHRREYASFQFQKHARAIETLRQKERLVPECLPCHSEHFRRTGNLPPGLATPTHSPVPRSPNLPVMGLQCSTCHGDGVVHSLLEGRGPITCHPSERLCRGCHDPEHDDDFNFTRDVQAIVHPRGESEEDG